MKEKLFLMFQKENSPVDAIIEMFRKEGWQFRLNDNSFFSKYKMPEIILSSSTTTSKIAEYRRKDTNWEIEGEFVFYYNNILSIVKKYCEFENEWKIYEYESEDFFNQTKYDNLEKNNALITEIIFVYISIFWIIHWSISPNYGIKAFNRQFIPFENDQDEQQSQYHQIHKPLVKLFATLFYESQLDKKKLFDWLIDKIDLDKLPCPNENLANLLHINVNSCKECINLLSFLRLFNYQTSNDIFKVDGIWNSRKFYSLVNFYKNKGNDFCAKYFICNLFGKNSWILFEGRLRKNEYAINFLTYIIKKNLIDYLFDWDTLESDEVNFVKKKEELANQITDFLKDGTDYRHVVEGAQMPKDWYDFSSYNMNNYF